MVEVLGVDALVDDDIGALASAAPPPASAPVTHMAAS